MVRQDVLIFAGGMAFIVSLIAAIFRIGHLRQWDADSGYTHNDSATSQERFLPEPFLPEKGIHNRDGKDAASRWYYWQLPPSEATSSTRLFVWLCYAGHQIFIWVVLFLAQQEKVNTPVKYKYTTQLSGWNLAAFGLNICFHLLHLLQTHTTYDGLAKDVSVASSQSSVIMLLVFILLIEYKTRGLFFGWPSINDTDRISRSLTLSYRPMELVRRYHGYAFAWASIYTFWYHPMENTWGHALGFFHTFIIMLQGSLMYTKLHLNPYWRLLLETWVTLHGGLVAYQTGGSELLGTTLWPMFAFGFAFALVFTQIFTLPFWHNKPVAMRFIPVSIFFAVVIYTYSWIPDQNGRTWTRMHEISRIPAVYYLFFFIAWFVLMSLLWIEGKIRNRKCIGGCGSNAVFVTATVLVFGSSVIVGWLFQYFDVQLNLIALMIIMVAIFLLFSCFAFIFLRQIFNHDLNGFPASSDIAAKSDNVTSYQYSGIENKQFPHNKK